MSFELSLTALLALTAATAVHASIWIARPRSPAAPVASAPKEVVLFYTQNLERAFSTVEVSDANGARVDQGKPRISASTMRVTVKPLPPGTYSVRWQVLSVDTHTTEGHFNFQVGK